ncbi:MAG TPA: PEP/pyruvate-binding domain-containing protein, partial [Kofleriaceae bacterium]|nr:PEP/pyruvate-binding domain-containing protein [Kofleriaceae bacterium]
MVIALAAVDVGDRCGGKAAALGAMLRAGLPVPDGFAIGGTLTPAEEAEVEARAAALGGTLAVRSSMSIEDAEGGAGAGVFASMVDVPAHDVLEAIRAVWDSATTPLAQAYARGRSIGAGVIVQRFVRGARVTIYTRPPGAPDRDEVWIGDARVARGSDDPRAVLALRAEAAIRADRGADVELIESDAGLFVVQARPIVHPRTRERQAPPDKLFAFTRTTPGVVWRWDAAHNPSPLSPAQAGLVDRVDDDSAAPYRMRLVAGYLYASPSEERAEAATDAGELRAIVRGALARALARLRGENFISAYVEFYRIWSHEAAPPIRATRRALLAEIPADDPAWHPRGTITSRLAAGDHDALRALAPAWDVAVPTLDERPDWLATPRAPIAAPSIDLDPRRALASAVAELAEEDDLAFARAQAFVRRALLAQAADRGIDPDDIFWLALEDETHDRNVAHARASAARTAAARAAQWDMPLAVADGKAIDLEHTHGRGFGGRATGRVIAIRDLAQLAPLPAGAIAVVPTVTPALALFAQHAAAIVADHGGALDHGVALARELGIPYVIARDA